MAGRVKYPLLTGRNPALGITMSILDLLKQGAWSLSAAAQTLTLFPTPTRHDPMPSVDVQAEIDNAWLKVWSDLRDCHTAMSSEQKND